jgi:hypothetical protein
MKTRISILMVVLSLLSASGYSQEKTKKELKEEKEIEQQRQTEALVNSKDFIFIARTAIPSGMKSVNLTSNTNYVKFQPEMIESELPYYGRAYGSVGYGGDSGVKFKGKPDEFSVVKGKKNFEVQVIYKGETDKYTLNLTVSYSGSASLSITSNNRSSISYNGEIMAPEKPEEKK